MNKDSKLVFITCDNNSDFETIINKLSVFNKGYFNEDINNKDKFLKNINNKFKVVIKKKIRTVYIYPNSSVAEKMLKNTLKLWFKISLNKNEELKLIELIKNHKKGKYWQSVPT